MKRNKWASVLVTWIMAFAVAHTAAVASLSTEQLRRFRADQVEKIHVTSLNHRAELKSLQKEQKRARLAFEASEKKARAEFFKSHEDGAERRIFVKSFISRRVKLLKSFKTQRLARVSAQQLELKHLTEGQRVALEAYKQKVGS